MTVLAFKKAVRRDVLLRLALMGPPGAGKTFSALAIATKLGAGRVALVDTERGSARKYADRFDFDHLELERHSPDDYVAAVEAATQGRYRALVIDSWSHAWSGRGGALEMVDESAKRSKSGNTFNAWRDVTPAHNRMVDALLAFPGHLIVTLRSKVEYVVENDGRKSVPRKVGMAPIQRDGVEYEFDIVGEMNLDNELVVGKTRCFELRERIFKRPGEDVAAILRPWLAGSPDPVIADYDERAAQIESLRALCKARGVDEATFKRLAKAVKLNQMPADEAMREAADWRLPEVSPRAPDTTPPAEQPPADAADPWGRAGEPAPSPATPPARAQHTTVPASQAFAEPGQPYVPETPVEPLDPMTVRMRRHLEGARMHLPAEVTVKGKVKTRAEFHNGLLTWAGTDAAKLHEAIEGLWKHVAKKDFDAHVETLAAKVSGGSNVLEGLRAEKATRGRIALVFDGLPEATPGPAPEAPPAEADDESAASVHTYYARRIAAASKPTELGEVAEKLSSDIRLEEPDKVGLFVAITARGEEIGPLAPEDRPAPKVTR